MSVSYIVAMDLVTSGNGVLGKGDGVGDASVTDGNDALMGGASKRSAMHRFLCIVTHGTTCPNDVAVFPAG